MASTTPRSKTAAVASKDPAPRRGPRRAPAVVRGPAGGDPDLEVLRTALQASIAEHHPASDLDAVDRAFDLAVEAHAAQRRATGEPYVVHPIASAQILADLGIDPVAIQAALLHDVPEDTEYSLTDVEERFGSEVAQLVDGVTKLSKFSTHSHEQQQAENIRKMLLAMAQDIRVVLIKLADRLHNMRTLYGLPSEKQVRIAHQTMEIYAPLAERLGIWQDEMGTGGPGLQGPRPRALPGTGQAARHQAEGQRELHRSRDRRVATEARGRRHRGRPPGATETYLQHLEEDAAQERGVRRDLRRLRHPPAGR
ncbi:MAG: HD domain-containing protein [Candidatus Limnocylindrales bacterium]